jgi:hypothetical protein
MTKFSHVVLYANHDTGEWSVDIDTTDARFPDGAVWNDETEEWEDPTELSEYGSDVRDEELLREIYALIDEKNASLNEVCITCPNCGEGAWVDGSDTEYAICNGCGKSFKIPAEDREKFFESLTNK